MKQPLTDRRSFVVQGCACGALVLGARALARAETVAAPATTGGRPADPDFKFNINGPQVIAVLSDIDRSGDKALIEAVFGRLGNQCFLNRPNVIALAEKNRPNFQGFVDWVNGGKSRYWEKLEYDREAGSIRVTGRKLGGCACAFAQCPNPPKALCTHCCVAFQARFFGAMTGRAATARIDETILLGGGRCRTTVQLLGGCCMTL